MIATTVAWILTRLFAWMFLRVIRSVIRAVWQLLGLMGPTPPKTRRGS